MIRGRTPTLFAVSQPDTAPAIVSNTAAWPGSPRSVSGSLNPNDLPVAGGAQR